MEQYVYTTNLDYPKQFKLNIPLVRRNGGEPKPLQPLQVGEYVWLPAFPKMEEGEYVPTFTYKINAIDEENKVDLELIYFRKGEPIGEEIPAESVRAESTW